MPKLAGRPEMGIEGRPLARSENDCNGDTDVVPTNSSVSINGNSNGASSRGSSPVMSLALDALVTNKSPPETTLVGAREAGAASGSTCPLRMSSSSASLGTCNTSSMGVLDELRRDR